MNLFFIPCLYFSSKLIICDSSIKAACASSAVSKSVFSSDFSSRVRVSSIPLFLMKAYLQVLLLCR